MTKIEITQEKRKRSKPIIFKKNDIWFCVGKNVIEFGYDAEIAYSRWHLVVHKMIWIKPHGFTPVPNHFKNEIENCPTLGRYNCVGDYIMPKIDKRRSNER